MGLDMYLKKNVYLSPYRFSPTRAKVESTQIDITEHLDNGNIETKHFTVKNQEFGIELELPVAYWRKANAIHKWFVDLNDGTDDCRPIRVNGEQLKMLVDTCKKVLADKDKAKELLPTCEGCFFGPTDYDDWYFEGIKRTIDMLDDIDSNADYIYEASW